MIVDTFRSKVAERINRALFVSAVRGVLRAPQAALGDTPYTLLSMVHHRDLLPYLLAVKSLCRFLPPRAVVLIADPTLTFSDRAVISQHIPAVVIREAAEFHDPDLPVGGTWERLIAIAEEVASGYVVQLDADTVAFRHLAEVKTSIRENSAFVLGTENNQSVQPSGRVAEWARGRRGEGDHVQIVAESQLDKLGGQFGRYVRGCSGFAGFPKDSFDRSTLKSLSAVMRPLLGEQWTAWGTEQFSSNLIVANSAAPTVLPHPAYCNPYHESPETVFMHFIGYARFVTGRYAKAAREVCAALNQTSSHPEAVG